MKKISFCNVMLIFSMLLMSSGISSAQLVDFEDVGLNLSSDSSYRGEDFAAEFISNGIRFNNSYNSVFDSWTGFSYSKRTSWNAGGASGYEEFQFGNDTVVTSPSNGSGPGFGGSDTWAVAFSYSPNDAIMATITGKPIESFYINNTRTTRHVIENGNGATPFSMADQFRLIFNRLDSSNNVLASHEVDPLATNGTVVDDWRFVNLIGTNIEGANRIGVELISTTGSTTPAYVAFDNIVVGVPEPTGAAVCGLFACVALLRRRQ